MTHADFDDFVSARYRPKGSRDVCGRGERVTRYTACVIWRNEPISKCFALHGRRFMASVNQTVKTNRELGY
ncbi:hypothetical protein [Bacillus cereus]|uniref:hypothetical protein n=1 Tax=Bacillus cereus TaxID=1396 RepID=UPI003D659F34